MRDTECDILESQMFELQKVFKSILPNPHTLWTEIEQGCSEFPFCPTMEPPWVALHDTYIYRHFKRLIQSSHVGGFWDSAGLRPSVRALTENLVVWTENVELFEKHLEWRINTLVFHRALLIQTVIKISKWKNYLIAEVDITRVPRMRW